MNYQKNTNYLSVFDYPFLFNDNLSHTTSAAYLLSILIFYMVV